MLKILSFIAISMAVTAVIAIGLILSQWPRDMRAGARGGEGASLDFTRQIARNDAPLPLQSAPMRDGWQMPYRRVEGPQGAPLLVLVHGSGWHGAQFDALARRLSDVVTVIAPDLRGHGAAPERRGDVDYIGQMEDDLADLIKAQAGEGQRVIMAGHSSGGGLVVRFAGGAHGAAVDHAVLLAPFLKYNAPTTRENSGGWAHVLTRRLIGLSMLNAAKITALNGMQVIQFNMPAAVLDGPLGHTATTAYSYRLNTGFAPRADYLADVARLPDFTLIAGTADEAFVAYQYEPLLSSVTARGTYHLIEGASHLDVVYAPETETLMRGVLSGD